MVKLTNSKKGAVELSLNLIIMLVIGLTVLALIIAFVTSFLGQAEDSFQGKLTEDDNTKIEQVKRESGNFAFLSSTVRVTQGDKTPGKMYVKIRNPTSDPYSFDGGQVPDSAATGPVFTVDITAGNIDGTYAGDSGSTVLDEIIAIYGPPIELTTGASEGYSLEVYAGKEVPLGTYYAKFKTTLGTGIDETVYDKVITINVE